jgi:hypothetical protein
MRASSFGIKVPQDDSLKSRGQLPDPTSVDDFDTGCRDAYGLVIEEFTAFAVLKTPNFAPFYSQHELVRVNLPAPLIMTGECACSADCRGMQYVIAPLAVPGRRVSWRRRKKMKGARTFRACGFISIVLLSLFAHFSPAQDNQLQNNRSGQDNPPARVARLSYLKGKASFLRAGVDQWSEATLNFPVTTGDRLYTEKDARAELQGGSCTARLAGSTDLTVTNLTDQLMQLGLEQGTLRVSMHQLNAGDTVEVDTPNGSLTLLDQGSYRVDTDPDGNRTTVSVNSGRLEITGGGVSQMLQSGQAARLTGHDSIQVESVPMPSPDSFDKWSEERDRQRASSKSSKYVSGGMPGYDDLDAHGHWDEVADYGPVWYPADVAVGWVPYRFGHWVWVGPWGWTWVEDEPWGFCPFHYGRWAYIGAAWGWVPGPIVTVPVYAPAFVAFLGGPGFSISVGVGAGAGLVGWFPLGPREPFFPWYHYSGDYLRVVNITNVRNVTNITNITSITNINNAHYAYRNIATTAVSSDAFSNGRPVAREVVKLKPEQLAKAQVIPHPGVSPTARAAMPGRPVPAPPVRAQRLATANRSPAGSVRPAPGEKRQPSPLVTRNAPPERSGTRISPSAPNPSRPNPSRLITRTPPPPPRAPFVQERQAMLEHPGRALAPQQMENMRLGRPVGPMLDREFPPHMGPVRPIGMPPPPPPRRRR